MTAKSNTISILETFFKRIEKAYGQALRFDENGSKKYGYLIGEGGIVLSVLERDGSLTMQVFEKMCLENTKGYLTCRGLPETLGGFAYKKAEEVQDILEKLCDILLKTPITNIDVQIVKKKVMEAEFACYQKYHQIPESTMQSMKFEAERAELNTLLKKG